MADILPVTFINADLMTSRVYIALCGDVITWMTWIKYEDGQLRLKHISLEI